MAETGRVTRTRRAGIFQLYRVGRRRMKVMRLVLLTLVAVLGWAQDAPEKPDPRRKARALLDGAAEMMAPAQPQLQVVAVLHLAANYHVFDSPRALEYFRQAFAASADLPPSATGEDV